MHELMRYHFLQGLSELSYVDEIYLYGSRARNTHHDRSDIDLAIVCPRASDQEWLEILESVHQADTLLKIDCVRFDRLKDEPLRSEILRDRVLLYTSEKK